MTLVTEPREEYTKALSWVERNEAAFCGERAIKAGQTKYLPPLPSMLCEARVIDGVAIPYYLGYLTNEGAALYAKYISNAYFYGATGRTVEGLVGLIFSKPAATNIQPKVKYLIDNADGRGNSLSIIARRACVEAFISPQSGFLVARPTTPPGASELQVEKNNLRPKIIHYKFKNIINWDYETVNNIDTLSMLVLKESTTKRDGYKVESIEQYRVLELIDGVYNQSIYDDAGQVISPVAPVTINGKTSEIIPFFWVNEGVDRKPAISDLVDANLQHYKIFADYGSKLHHSSFIIYTETGARPDSNMLIGNGVKWTNSDESAAFGILQPDGNADSHRIALQDMEQRMAALGAEQLKPRLASAESGEAKSLDQVAQNSTTANVANAVSATVRKAIDFVNFWMRGSGESEYKLNTDYNPTGMNPQMLTSLLAAWQGGAISYETFYDNLQRGEIASVLKNAEDEKNDIIREISDL